MSMFKIPAVINFAKVKEGAIIPSKRDEDAGYDIYACFEEDYMIINPHTTVMIPTGIASAFELGFVAVLKERGSNGVLGIAQRAGIIDSGYRNEWFVPLTNTNDVPIIIAKESYLLNQSVLNLIDSLGLIVYPYKKAICQALLLPAPKTSVKEITYEELKAIPSERGMGSRGSSNK